MQKGYKICLLIYSGMLIFSILFMLMLLGASSHKVNLKSEDLAIPVFALISISLLSIFPRVSSGKISVKLIVGVSAIVCLLISLYFALENLFSTLTENLIIEFKTFTTLFSGIFIATIIYLIKQIFIELHYIKGLGNRENKRRK